VRIPSPRARSGAILLVIIVIVALLLFLGFTLWQIWKMLRNLPPRTLPPDTATAEVQQASGETLAEFQAQHPGEPVSLVSTQVIVLTGITPFQAENLTMRVWRSTNLTTWELVGTNRPDNTWTDTNPPWPCGFYKQIPSYEP